MVAAAAVYKKLILKGVINMETIHESISKELKCRDCIYFHMYKKLRRGKWRYSGCCTYYIQNPEHDTPSCYDWVIEAEECDLCEMFKERM